MSETADTRQRAIALRYDPDDGAPRVVAKGYGTIAENIIRCARDSGLYVHASPELVGLLMQVDLDRHIPPALYQAIAELLAWIYALEHGADSADDPAALASGLKPETSQAPA